MIYHRRECDRIRPWYVGVQWWHGPNVWLATHKIAIRLHLGTGRTRVGRSIPRMYRIVRWAA